ncbi:sensor histidine kinase [Streptomyces boluensis]|uniref:histidine kinase n=1 Tax=Streptomyces boluensis TaxID=1775135 RepID=A0A964UUE7_9ACTN|nr:sensor histidine kinase [Streptomyces boluensis]NBE55556.1 sensor histidine kinase [Streptomyces boluensis]
MGEKRSRAAGSDTKRTRLAGTAVAALVAAVVAALGCLAASSAGATAVDYGLVIVGSLALAGHATAPRTVLAVTTLCLSVHVLHAHPGAVAAVPVIGAVHTAARVGYRGVAAVATGIFLAAVLTSGLLAGEPVGDFAGRALLLAGWFLCALVTGLADKNWQAYLRQTEKRAAEAERTREEAARRRAGEERLRIARELHDSLTHSISIVKLQAGVAVHLARKRGEEVPEALLAIQEASGEAMRELRATLDVLREERPPGSLADLVRRARAAGLAVELTLRGTDGTLPDAVEAAAYRIVQEALTNAARHAGPTGVSVELALTEGELEVRVTDDGRASPDRPCTPGTGLTGMRERVTALGGTLRAGPRAEGGFAVRARLPLQARGQAPSQLRGRAPSQPQPQPQPHAQAQAQAREPAAGDRDRDRTGRAGSA